MVPYKKTYVYVITKLSDNMMFTIFYFLNSILTKNVTFRSTNRAIKKTIPEKGVIVANKMGIQPLKQKVWLRKKFINTVTLTIS